MRVTNTGRWIRLLVAISLVLSSVPLLSALTSCPTPAAGVTSASAIRLATQGVTFSSTAAAPCTGGDVLTYQWQYSLNQTTWKFFDGVTETAPGGVFAGATITNFASTGVATPYAAPVLTIATLPKIVPQVYIQLQVTDTSLSPQGSSVTNSVTLEVYQQNAWFPNGTPAVAANGATTPGATFVRGALLPDGKVMAVGFDGTITDSNAPVYLDKTPGTAPNIDTWVQDTAVLPYQLQRPTVTLLPTGQVLIAGGLRGTVNEQSAAYLYTEGAALTTVGVGPMITARDSHTATLLLNGRVLVTGGANKGAALASAELFHRTVGTNWGWSYTTTTVVPATPAVAGSGGVQTMLNIARMHHTATLLRDGTVLIVGGNEDNANISALNSAEIYDPVTGNFTLLNASLQYARAYHTATLLPNGDVLIAGGIGMNGQPLNTAEVYYPATKTFKTVPALMGSTRADHTATLMAPSAQTGWSLGKVLLSGGGYGNTFLSSSEYFTYTSDPGVDGVFSPANPLVTGRDRQGAWLVKNGDVVTLGGNASNTTLATSAETFQDISEGTPVVPTFGSQPITIGPALSNGTTGTATGGYFGETFAFNVSSMFDGMKPTYYATCNVSPALTNGMVTWSIFGLDPLVGNNAAASPRPIRTGRTPRRSPSPSPLPAR